MERLDTPRRRAKEAPKRTPRSPRQATGFQTAIKKADYVSAFARGLEVLRLFGHEAERVSVSSAAARTGLSRAAARRFLLTLNELGYVTMTDEWFELRPKVLELGYSYVSTWRTPELVTPYLREGVKVMNENVSFGVLDGQETVYVARVEARRLVQSLVITIGSRVPAVLSAMGRVLLAHQPPDMLDAILDRGPLPRMTSESVTDPKQLRHILDQVRAQDWSLVAEEFEIGVTSIAVPIRGAGGEVVAAITMGAPTTRVSNADMTAKFLPELQRVGAKISHAVAMSGLR